MSITVGTNCGFMSTQPTTTPTGDMTVYLDNSGSKVAFKATSPTGSYKLTEIGFYDVQTTFTGGLWKAALYTDNSGVPGTLVGSEFTGQSLTTNTPAWYRYSDLSVTLVSNTVYWIVVGVVYDGSHQALIPTSDSSDGGTGGVLYFGTYTGNLTDGPYTNYKPAVYALYVASSSVSLSGTATNSITETDVVSGGKTVILTLTGDTWIA